jgi:uncharacterized phage-associated protein
MVRFEFNRTKFVELMKLLAERVPDLDMLKTVKMLYFIDRDCLLHTARPVLGDTYYRMDLGPVPSAAYDILKDIHAGDGHETGLFLDNDQKYPRIKASEKSNLEVFSEEECRCIERVIGEYGSKTGWALSEISHNHRSWLACTAQHERIDYLLFFPEELGEYKDAFDTMLLEQEDRDFDSSL